MNIAIIPARGGSKRIPGKNIREFHGKPIIAYSIEAARKSGLFQHLIVSTDSDEVAAVARQYRAKVLKRPVNLADDQTATWPVIQHALEVLDSGDHPIKPKNTCCIYPCAPMIDPLDLKHAELVIDNTDPHRPWYCVPVAEWLKDPGQFYFGASHAFLSGITLISNRTRLMQIDPRRAIDINTEDDWQQALTMYEELHK